MKSILIKDTTRAEREALILDALTSCAGGGCENCSGCGVFGAGDAFEMYRPYIDGVKEIAEISAEFSAKYIKG
jgi:hypothetical protein